MYGGSVSDAFNKDDPFKALGNSGDHISQEGPGEAVQGTAELRVVPAGNVEEVCLLIELYEKVRMMLEIQSTLWSGHANLP